MATIERAIPVGGAAFNFSIVGGTTAPTNPKENTIWVNTNMEITGWAFDAEEPADPVQGSVWIKTGNASPAAFNVLKKNAIVIYPNSAMQWSDSAWVKKETLLYKNGEWEKLMYILYENGTFNIAYSQTGNLGGITIGTDSIRFYNTGYPVDYYYQYLTLGELIDWSKFSVVKVTLSSYAYSSSKPCYIAVGTAKNNRDLASKAMGASYTQELDVSGVNSEGYLNIGIQVGAASTGTTDVYVKKIEIY